MTHLSNAIACKRFQKEFNEITPNFEDELHFASYILNSCCRYIRKNERPSDINQETLRALQMFVLYDHFGQTTLATDKTDQNKLLTPGEKLDIVLPRLADCFEVKHQEDIQDMACRPCRVFSFLPDSTTKPLLTLLLRLVLNTVYYDFKITTPKTLELVQRIAFQTLQLYTTSPNTGEFISKMEQYVHHFPWSICKQEENRVSATIQRVCLWTFCLCKLSNTPPDLLLTYKNALFCVTTFNAKHVRDKIFSNLILELFRHLF